MILRRERMAGDTRAGRLRMSAIAAIADLRTEAAIGSPQLAAIGLVVSAMALQTIVFSSPGHFRPAGIGIFAVLVAVGTLGSLVLAFCGTLHLKSLLPVQGRRALGTFGLALLAVLSVLGTVRGAVGITAAVHGATYTNDGAVMDLYAAKQSLAGHNPYVKQNIVTALADMNAPSTTTTPLMEGQFRGIQTYPSPEAVQQVFLNVLVHRPHTIPPEFESKYNYPAGSFLAILPFVWMGFRDLRFLYIFALVLMGAYLWRRLPSPLRPLAPLLILANVPLVFLTTGGQPDPLYGLFLLIGLAEWPSRWTSPLAMGLAIATKQLAWFFLPLYCVWVVRRFGWHEATRRCGIMAAVFAVLNGPFIIRAPDSYFASISGPVSDPMFPLGVGIMALFVSGVLPMIPKLVFSIAEIGSWVAAVYAAGRIRAITIAGSAALGALPLFFAWRSLVNYFYLIPILVLAIVFADASREQRETRTVERAPGS